MDQNITKPIYKRLLSLVLIFALVAGLVAVSPISAGASAAEPEKIVGWEYTGTNPATYFTNGNPIPTTGSGEAGAVAANTGVYKDGAELSNSVNRILWYNNPRSIEAGSFGPDDSWELKFSTAGYENLKLSSFAMRVPFSSQGPTLFKLFYSIDGINFFPVTTEESDISYDTGGTDLPDRLSASIAFPAETFNQEMIYVRVTGLSGNGGGTGWHNVGAIVFEGSEVEVPAGAAKLHIAAVYGGNIDEKGARATDVPVSHSFVEIYNPNDFAVRLDGYSLFYQGYPTQQIGRREGWARLALNPVINLGAKCSYLINCGVTADGRTLVLNDFDQNWENAPGFVTKGAKYVITHGVQSIDSAIVNPFNTDGNGTKIDGYIDMFGSAGNDNGSTDGQDGFETAYHGASSGSSKQKGYARIERDADTDNNCDDFALIDYREAQFVPRSMKDGALEGAAVEKAALTALIIIADKKVQNDYAQESWTTFAAALNTARAVEVNVSASQEQVDAARTNLQVAMDALKVIVDLGQDSLSYQDLLISTGIDESQLLFTWYTAQPVGKLAVRKSGESGYTEIEALHTARTGKYIHKAVINNLLPATTYEYRLVGENNTASAMHSINIGVPGSFSFFAVGDPQIGSSNVATDMQGWKDTLNKAVDSFPDASFLLSVGDQVETAGTASHYTGYLSPSELMSLPTAHCVGNHDSGNQLYLDHYSFPNQTQVGSGVTNVDYWYRYGSVLFLNLDSNTRSISAHRTFLDNAIAANPDAKWKVVSFHHSPYSEASHANDADQIGETGRRQTWTLVFDELGIDIVLAGHDHSYTRTYQMIGNQRQDDQNWLNEQHTEVLDPTGTLYIELNSASGSKYYRLTGDNSATFSAHRHQFNVPEFSVIDMTDDSFTITTYRTDTMAILDTYTIRKTSTEIEPTTEINIFSFNDFHGAVQQNANSEPGAARFAAVMNHLKADNPNAFVLANGDNYQGSAVSNHYLGKPVSDMIKAMGVEYSSIGNHEFDFGNDKIAQYAQDGNIIFLCANLFLKGTDERPDFCEPYAIKEIGGKKIGIVGYILTSTPTLVKAEHVEDFDFRNPGPWLRDIVNDLKNSQGCDAVIALAHGSGNSLSSYGFDGIFDGHSHSLSVSNSGVPIVQASYNGRAIGRLQLIFDNVAGTLAVTASYNNNVNMNNGSIVPINVVDEALKEKIDWYVEDSAPIFERVVGQADVALSNQSAVNNWATGLLYDYVKRQTGIPYVVIQNSGGWRSMSGEFKEQRDDITYRWLMRLMPFDNEIVLMDLKGSDLILALRGSMKYGSGSTAGLVITGATGSGNTWYLADGTLIEPDSVYKVVCNDFMYTGGDRFDMFADSITMQYLGEKLRDAMANEIAFRSSVSLETKVGVDIRTEEYSDFEKPVAYIISMQGMKNIMNARIYFEVDGNMLYSQGLEVLLDGFSALNSGNGDIRWSNQDDIWTGEILLMHFGQDGFSSDVREDLARVLYDAKQLGEATMRITKVMATGLDENGNPVALESEIGTAEATTSVIKVFSIFDMNKDGVINEIDLAYAQCYYQVREGDALWEKAKEYDVDGVSVGVVDMLDLVAIFLQFTH